MSSKNETNDYLPRPLRAFAHLGFAHKSAIFRGFWRFWRRRLRKYQPETGTGRNDRLRAPKTPRKHTCADKQNRTNFQRWEKAKISFDYEFKQQAQKKLTSFTVAHPGLNFLKN